MGAVDVIFARSHSIGSIGIRAVTWSRWSHCAIVLPSCEAVIEATWPHGVRYSSLSGLIQRSSRHEFIEVDVPNPDATYRFLRLQLGRPYDTWGVLGLGLHREWQDPQAWWCSELVEAALAAGGRCRFRADAQRVTQQHSWMVN